MVFFLLFFLKETHKILLQDAFIFKATLAIDITKFTNVDNYWDVIKISIHTILQRNLENVCTPYRYWNLQFK